MKVNTLWMQSQVLKSKEHTRLLTWYVAILRMKVCFFNKRVSITTVGKIRLSHVLQAPGKPWGFGILHIALPTGKDNTFFPQKPLLLASKLEIIPQWRNVLFPFGYSTAMHILSNLVWIQFWPHLEQKAGLDYFPRAFPIKIILWFLRTGVL